MQRSLQIRLDKPEKILREQLTLFDDDPVLYDANESLTTEVRPYDTLVLEYHDPNRKRDPISISLTADGRLLGRYRRERFPLGMYLTTSTRSPKEDAERFSNLERVGRQDEVLESLRLLEPRLQRLTLLVVDGEPIINGDI